MLKLRRQYPNIGRFAWLMKVLWAALCYRLINLIETFETVGGIPELGNERPFLKSVKRLMQGRVVFTGAHQNMGFSRYKQTLMVVAKSLTTMAGEISAANVNKNLRECYRVITGLKNVGQFFAWQVTCDLMECGCLPNCTEDDYVKLGAGAIKGIKLIFGDNVSNESDQVEMAKLLRKVQDEVFDDLQVTFPRFDRQDLTVKNIEHALCEFQKYNSIQRKLRAG
jgi:alpha-glutamyl/putrescinyl thymine pyrophosphorylase clade 1